MDITDIFRTFHPKATEYTFFSSAHGTFSRIDHILGPKSGLNQYQKIGIIPCIFSDHNALKLELNQKRKFGKNPTTWKLKSTLLKNEWVNQEIKEELKKLMETNENENTKVQNLWTAKAFLRGKYIGNDPVFWYRLRPDLRPRMCSLLENVPCALEKNVYSVALGWNALNIFAKSIWSSVSFKVLFSLLIPHLDDLSITV